MEKIILDLGIVTEVIKILPLAQKSKTRDDLETAIWDAKHRHQMLEQAFKSSDFHKDDLSIMDILYYVTSNVSNRIEEVLKTSKAKIILVYEKHFMASFTFFYLQILAEYRKLEFVTYNIFASYTELTYEGLINI